MTPGPYEARHAPGIPTDCCDFGVVSLTAGREVCRVWERDDVEHITKVLNENERLRALVLNIQARAETGFPISEAALANMANRCREALGSNEQSTETPKEA